MVLLGSKYYFNLKNFYNTVFNNIEVKICDEAIQRLDQTREFVDYLLTNKIKIYGLTTGFADLRNQSIPSMQAAKLSCNLIESHDAGIGASLSPEVVLGAMIIRASSLAKGYSAFQSQSLKTLVSMINSKIIPLVPCTGSLGASGDLAFLARIGRAMQGGDVAVYYEGKVVSAKEAFDKEKIKPFIPLAKEGLAITNGTAFMASMISIAYLQEIHELENIVALQGLFYNAIGAVDAAFNESIQTVRGQFGQKLISEILSSHFKSSPFIDFEGMQDDYCIRCIPQVLGSKIELILEQGPKIERELNAVTDNPLFFKEEEISSDVEVQRIHKFNNESWAVLSGGNFHGECITTVADAICTANAKIALTLERQITFMLNPYRNKNKLPCYLVADSKEIGLVSGYMITQYTANALAQKIAYLGLPASIFNITSANESEDIVSYGATAAERLLEQVKLMRELNAIYLTVVTQAYSITRKSYVEKGNVVPKELLAEQLFQEIKKTTQEEYPILKEENFERRYRLAASILSQNKLREIMDYPLSKEMNKSDQFSTESFIEIGVKLSL